MRPALTTLLIVANVVAFVWQTTTGGGIDYDHGYLSPQSVLEHGQWWRIFTAAFLHGSIAHIGLNMLALYWLGREVEAFYGKARFALLYVLAIVGSGLAIVYFSAYTVPTLGASGAIYGLFGALVAVGLRLGKRGRAMIMSMLPVVAINLAFTFSVPGISAAAHVGGLITGFLVGLVLFTGARQRRIAYAYAYAAAPAGTAAPVATIEQTPEVETIEQPPDAGPHEEAGAPPLHVRDPRE
ncbi:MAG TPA: rhomboid family intramembrane serine protease [Candidatus Elarobacter sp.]|nr:rhomboid family intramembrane serine protease [Candidatus Elarobacter sp.]